MHFNDEVVPSERVAGLEVKAKVDDRELKMATQLIDSLTTAFKPQKYRDEFREQVMAVIEKKAAGEDIHTAPTTEEKESSAHRSRNLMAALEQSLARSRSGSGSGEARTRTSHARSTRRRKSA
jgi:DNA end-binding protein Ku